MGNGLGLGHFLNVKDWRLGIAAFSFLIKINCMSRKNNHKKNFKRQSKGFVDKTDYLKGFEKFDIPRLELEPHEIKNVFPAQGEKGKVIVVGNGNVGATYFKKLWDAALPKYSPNFGTPIIFGTAGEISENEGFMHQINKMPRVFETDENIANPPSLIEMIGELSEKFKEDTDIVTIGGEKYSMKKLISNTRCIGLRGTIASQLLMKYTTEQMFSKPEPSKYIPVTNFEPKVHTPFTYLAENFIVVKQPDGSALNLWEHQIKEIEWWKKMSETHIPQIIKMRTGGTKIVWRKRKEEE